MGPRAVNWARRQEKSRGHRACVYGEDVRVVAGSGLLEGTALRRHEQKRGKLGDRYTGDGED